MSTIFLNYFESELFYRDGPFTKNVSFVGARKKMLYIQNLWTIPLNKLIVAPKEYRNSVSYLSSIDYRECPETIGGFAMRMNKKYVHHPFWKIFLNCLGEIYFSIRFFNFCFFPEKCQLLLVWTRVILFCSLSLNYTTPNIRSLWCF